MLYAENMLIMTLSVTNVVELSTGITEIDFGKEKEGIEMGFGTGQEGIEMGFGTRKRLIEMGFGTEKGGI